MSRAGSIARPLPAWVRAGSPSGIGAAVQAGAALALLDAAWTMAASFAGAWAERLAVATTTCALTAMGRPEDEAAVRDLVALGAPPSAGPAAPLAGAFLWLAAEPPEEDPWSGLPDRLAGLGARSGTAAADLAAALAEAARQPCPLTAVAAAMETVEAIRPGRPSLARFAADAVLSRWLGWPRGLPLVTLGLPTGRTDGDPAPVIVKGAMAALDRHADLGRRAAALEAVRPRLRARAAGRVLDRLLDHDALAATGVRDLMSERAGRRLFDRLASLGVVREMTGRATFRLYGL